MNESPSLILVNLFVAVLVALVMGYIAQRLRLPVIVGYLLAGVVVGPYTPGFRSDVALVRELAEIGVAFLLFAVGTHVNLHNLRRVQRIGVLGGVLQVVLTSVLGALVARSLGVAWVSGIFFGFLIALSSTAVAVKILTDRGEMESLYGRIAMSLLVVQDLLIIPIVLVLPVLSDPADNFLLPLLLAVGKAVLLLGGGIFVGAKLLPKLLDKVAETGSRELMLFATVSIALGAAIGTQYLGVSAAIGAFVGGLVVSGSQVSRQVSSAFSPLRDLFGIFFFISVGMVLDFNLLLSKPVLTAATVAVAVLGKGLIVFLVTWAFGYSRRISLMVALVLAQVGEFSFILAGVGLGRGLISLDLYTLVISSALVSIFLSPFLVSFGGRGLEWAKNQRTLKKLFLEAGRHSQESAGESLSGHAIVGGFGRVGRELVETLAKEGIESVVIEHSPAVARELEHRKIPYVYGDFADQLVLSEAGVGTARLLALTIPDPAAAQGVLQRARALNPKLAVVIRVHYAQEMASLRSDDLVHLVDPEFEAGMHFARLALRVYDLDPDGASEYLEARRVRHYEDG